MRPATDEDHGHDEKRAAAGVARFSRTWLPRLVVVAVVGVFAWAALRGSDGPGGPSDQASQDDSPSDQEGSDTTAARSASVDVTDTQPPDVPTDVEEERPAVDLSQPPDGTDPFDVARWWGGTYVRWSGAEPPAALAERLAGVVTPELRSELAAEPPAASYGEPVEIVGAGATAATGRSSSTATGASGSTTQAQVAVETAGALLVYDVTLTADGSGVWRVAEATVV